MTPQRYAHLFTGLELQPAGTAAAPHALHRHARLLLGVLLLLIGFGVLGDSLAGGVDPSTSTQEALLDQDAADDSEEADAFSPVWFPIVAAPNPEPALTLPRLADVDTIPDLTDPPSVPPPIAL